MRRTAEARTELTEQTEQEGRGFRNSDPETAAFLIVRKGGMWYDVFQKREDGPYRTGRKGGFFFRGRVRPETNRVRGPLYLMKTGFLRSGGGAECFVPEKKMNG